MSAETAILIDDAAPGADQFCRRPRGPPWLQEQKIGWSYPIEDKTESTLRRSAGTNRRLRRPEKVHDEDAVPISKRGMPFGSQMEQATIRPSVRLGAVCTGVPDAVVSVDMVVEVILVPEALPALPADKPVRPRFVVVFHMVTVGC